MSVRSWVRQLSDAGSQRVSAARAGLAHARTVTVRRRSQRHATPTTFMAASNSEPNARAVARAGVERGCRSWGLGAVRVVIEVGLRTILSCESATAAPACPRRLCRQSVRRGQNYTTHELATTGDTVDKRKTFSFDEFLLVLVSAVG